MSINLLHYKKWVHEEMASSLKHIFEHVHFKKDLGRQLLCKIS